MRERLRRIASSDSVYYGLLLALGLAWYAMIVIVVWRHTGP